MANATPTRSGPSCPWWRGARRPATGTVRGVVAPPPLDTGFPTADAQDDFQRARRRQVLSRLARRVGREPGDVDVILPYEEVVAALGYLEESYVGLQTVPLDSILGTVDRAKGFDRQFRPTTARVRARWERIANAVRRGEPMPPISLYRIGEVHFVRDGHHRVSVARALGRSEIEAYVVQVGTRIGADRTLRMEDLPKKSHERLFHERIPLPARARGRIAVADAWDYGTLAEAVEAWTFRLMQDRAEFVDRATAARLWFDEEYAPVVEMLREADMIGGGSETDAYLRVAADRYRLMRTHEWSPDVLAQLRDDQRR
ncbi:MAG: hypothetical protein QOI62_3265 [Solirubrobacteraceae bacterium]|nr:hypothetical protein [Solirubrobacteraceae bacterium]MEA2360005.1 hypothetical protein [Solirubrobacteraceae bacterium]